MNKDQILDILAYSIAISYIATMIVEFGFFTMTGKGITVMEPNPFIAGTECLIGMFAGARIVKKVGELVL